MRVFLDIGAHMGQTLHVATDPRWGFDRIECFEPAPSCWPTLEALADARTRVHRFGLWDRDVELELHNAGTTGASICADKDGASGSVLCQFRDAAQWFEENLGAGDVVFAKINTEGAEVEIIDRLAETGQLAKIAHLVIHFDARKAPSRVHLVAETERKLRESNVEFHDADPIFRGSAQRGTRAWLQWCFGSPPVRDIRLQLATLEIRARQRLFPIKRRLTRG